MMSGFGTCGFHRLRNRGQIGRSGARIKLSYRQVSAPEDVKAVLLGLEILDRVWISQVDIDDLDWRRHEQHISWLQTILTKPHFV